MQPQLVSTSSGTSACMQPQPHRQARRMQGRQQQAAGTAGRSLQTTAMECQLQHQLYRPGNGSRHRWGHCDSQSQPYGQAFVMSQTVMSGMYKTEAAMPVSRLTRCHPDPVLCKRRRAAGGPQHHSPRRGQQQQQRQVIKLQPAQATGPSHRPGLPQRLKQRRRGPGRAQHRPAHQFQGVSPQASVYSSAGRRRVPRNQVARHHRISRRSHNSLGSVLIPV